MAVFVIVSIIIIVFTILIFAIPLRVKFYYSRENKKDIFIININLMWGLIKFNISEPDVIFKRKILAPVIKVSAKMGLPESENKITQKEEITYSFGISELLEITHYTNYLVKKYDSAIRYLLRSTTVYDFIWLTSYGFENPAYAGMAYGMFWSIKSIIFNYLQGKIKKVLNKPRFNIQPNFFSKGYSTRISCIFALRIGHIITAGLKILVILIFKRGVKV